MVDPTEPAGPALGQHRDRSQRQAGDLRGTQGIRRRRRRLQGRRCTLQPGPPQLRRTAAEVQVRRERVVRRHRPQRQAQRDPRPLQRDGDKLVPAGNVTIPPNHADSRSRGLWSDVQLSLCASGKAAASTSPSISAPAATSRPPTAPWTSSNTSPSRQPPPQPPPERKVPLSHQHLLARTHEASPSRTTPHTARPGKHRPPWSIPPRKMLHGGHLFPNHEPTHPPQRHRTPQGRRPSPDRARVAGSGRRAIRALRHRGPDDCTQVRIRTLIPGLVFHPTEWIEADKLILLPP